MIKPRPKLLTERQAWLVIAKAFRDPKENRLNEFGLCCAVLKAETGFRTYRSMSRKLSKLVDHAKETGRIKSDYYLWEPVPRNKPHRARLAEKFARDCGREARS